MPKPKRKLTPEQRRARRLRKQNSMVIFINGKQKRVPRPPTIDGMPVDEFIERNADPIWLKQEEMWELMPFDDLPHNVQTALQQSRPQSAPSTETARLPDDFPF